MLRIVLAITLTIVCYYDASAEWRNVAEIWKGYDISPEAQKSIRGAQNPDGADCCGTADGIPVEFDIKDGHYLANWDGGWRQIDDRKVVKNLKGVAFPIIWLTKGNVQKQNPDNTYTDMGYREVRCFWPGAGG